jgi:aminoglycoside 3-N-acetyltransferase I
MNPQYETRALGANDVATLRGMLAMFGSAFNDPGTYCSQPPGDSYLSELLSSENFVAVAALHGNEVIGGVAAYILPKFEQARKELYIYDLAVSEAHRRAGVATALIEEVKGLARRRGVYVIFVQADYGDGPAIALYNKVGAQEEVLHFDILPTGSAT